MLMEAALNLTLKYVPHALVKAMVGEFVPIFMLHRYVNLQGEPDNDKIQQLETYLHYLRKNQYTVLSLDTLLALVAKGETLPPKAVVFTIDDGFEDHTEIAGKTFSRYDYPVTLFVITDFIDGKLWPWDDHVKHVLLNTQRESFKVVMPNGGEFRFDIKQGPRKEQSHAFQDLLKSQNQTDIYPWLHSLYEQGGMEFCKQAPQGYKPTSWGNLSKFVAAGHAVAAHTKSHRILSQLSDEEAQLEIFDSVRVLKEKVPEASNCFAYPTGRQQDFLPRDEKLVKQAGAVGAVSTVAATATSAYPITSLPRYALPQKMTDFLQYLSFVEHAKNRLREK